MVFFGWMIPLDQLCLNLAYILMAAGLLVRDMSWLRILLTGGQISFVTYAVLTDNFSMTVWNSLFIAVNSGQLIRLFWEQKPVILPPDLIDLYLTVFSVMTKREFLLFWETGKMQNVDNQFLIREGTPQTELSLIVSGTVVVGKQAREVTRLTRGKFIAEMSFLTEEPASADVWAEGPVSYISWDQAKLARLKQVNPDLLIKLQAILGKDLSYKLKMLTR